MGVIKKSFSNTLNIIKKNKLLIVSLILLQIIFLVSVSATIIKYQIAIAENAKEIIEPLQNANYNATSIEGGQPFMSNMMNEIASISKSYQKMLKSIFEMIFMMFGAFLVFNGLIWSSLNYLVKKKKFISYWIRFVILSIAFLIPIGVISYYLLKGLMSISMEVSGAGLNTVMWLFIITSYFLIISFCLTREKISVKKIFSIGIMKIHWILLGFMFSLGAILLSLIFVYFYIGNLILMIVSGLVLAIVLVLGKLFLINVVKEIK